MGFNINVVPDLISILVQLVATTVLFFFMGKFLYEPVSEMIAKRQAYIEEGVQLSKEVKAEKEQLEEKYEQRMLEAKTESSQIISEARSYSEDLKAKAVNESKQLAAQEYEKGVQALETEKQKVMKSMNDEIADMALVAAEKVIRQKVNRDTDRQMVKSLIKDLENSNE